MEQPVFENYREDRQLTHVSTRDETQTSEKADS